MPKSKKKKYEEEILQVIEKKKIMRFSHIFAHYAGCSMSTAYNHELEKLESIKSRLESNRQKATDYLLQKWIASDNPTLQIAAMRLVAPEEDRRRLNQQYVEYKEDNENKITQIEIVEPQDKKDNNDK